MKISFLLILSIVSSVSYAQWLQAGAKISVSDNIGMSSLGFSVGISGDGKTVVAGGPNDDDHSGAAWIFVKDGTQWVKQAKLVGTGAATFNSNAGQGVGVAISDDGNTVAVGGYWDDDILGAVWIFVRTGNTWTQQGNKLVPEDAEGKVRFGEKLELSEDGNTLIVGGTTDNETEGAVWIFQRVGTTWSQSGPKIKSAEAGKYAGHGRSVAISPDDSTIAVGAHDNLTGLGVVLIFAMENATWVQEGPALTVVGDESTFGGAVALSYSGDTLVVGSYSHNSSGVRAFTFIRENKQWTQFGEPFIASDPQDPSYGWTSVAITHDGRKLIAGGEGDNNSYGAFWTFSYCETGFVQAGLKTVGSGVSFGAPPYCCFPGARQSMDIDISADGATAVTGGIYDSAGFGAIWIFNAQEPLFVDCPDVTSIKKQSLSDDRLQFIHLISDSDPQHAYLTFSNLAPGTEVKIFSATGLVIYTSSNYQNDWNGKNCPEGMYYFTVSSPDTLQHRGRILITR